MFSIAKRTGIGALLLIILPVLLWIGGWQWRSASNYRWLLGLYWLTQTVNSPWVILTSILLISWFFWCLHYRLKPALSLVLILVTTLLIGQGMKYFLKELVQKPRPFVVWLDQQHYYSIDFFYAMPHKARSATLAHELQSAANNIPPWLQCCWRHKTGFSFPSGHTIFATSWALLAVGLLWPNRHVVTTLVMLVWASGVMVSRIGMGLHWPQDLIMSIVVSWFIITLACWLIQRFIGTLKPESSEEMN